VHLWFDLLNWLTYCSSRKTPKTLLDLINHIGKSALIGFGFTIAPSLNNAALLRIFSFGNKTGLGHREGRLLSDLYRGVPAVLTVLTCSMETEGWQCRDMPFPYQTEWRINIEPSGMEPFRHSDAARSCSMLYHTLNVRAVFVVWQPRRWPEKKKKRTKENFC
jgi:hypothetical protein